MSNISVVDHIRPSLTLRFLQPSFFRKSNFADGGMSIMPYSQQLSDIHKIYSSSGDLHHPPDAVDIKRLLQCAKIALFSSSFAMKLYKYAIFSTGSSVFLLRNSKKEHLHSFLWWWLELSSICLRNSKEKYVVVCLWHALYRVWSGKNYEREIQNNNTNLNFLALDLLVQKLKEK